MRSALAPSLSAITRTLLVAIACLAFLSACPSASTRAPDYPGSRLVGSWEIAPDLHPAWIDHVKKNAPAPDSVELARKLGAESTRMTFTKDGSMTIAHPLLGKNWDQKGSYSVVEDTPALIRLASPNRTAGSPTDEASVYFIDADTIRMGQGEDESQYLYWRRMK